MHVENSIVDNSERHSFIVGDCLEVIRKIPDKSIDVVITSPPYNKHNTGGKISKKINYELHEDNLPEDFYENWLLKVLLELYRVLKQDGIVFWNHKVRYYQKKMYHPVTLLAKTPFILWQEIVWHRMIFSNPRGWRLWEVDERIYWMLKQPLKEELSKDITSMTSVWSIPPDANKTPHPCPFTHKIVSNLIKIAESVLKRELVIMDPFAGICTVAYVANHTKHRTINIDINKKYIEYGLQRIISSQKLLF